MYGAGLSIYYLGFGALSGFALGVLAALVLAALFGLFALRTSGVSFLIVTMMFGQACYLVILYFNEVTLGDQGFILSDRLPEALVDPNVKYNVALVVFAVCFLVSLVIVRSPLGRILVAIRENEERTRLLGYNTYACKLVALVISGGMAGAAGAAYALLFLLRGRVVRRDPALDLPTPVGADGRCRNDRGAGARHRAHVLPRGRDQRLDQRLPLRGGRGVARAGPVLPARHHGDGAREARAVAAVSVALLETEGLGRRFGGLSAVEDVSLAVEPGEIRAVIGPNGAGKTTLVGMICGRLPPSAGAVRFEGRDITAMPAWRRVAAGSRLHLSGDEHLRCAHGARERRARGPAAA